MQNSIEPSVKRIRSEMSDPNAEMDMQALNKFSRQNAAFGAETTAKLIKMRVIIYGLRGIGAETAKNLALQGAGGITLVDPSPVAAKDLGVNFFYTEDDVASGHSRASVFAPRLRELNPMCDVKVAEDITPGLIRLHNALVVCNSNVRKSELIRLNELCRASGASFLYAFNGGLATSVFVDHGGNHVVNDPNGEKPQQKLITGIAATGKPNEYFLRYTTPEGQIDGNINEGRCKISDVLGCDELNGKIVDVTHSAGDPVKTVRVILEGVPGLDRANGGLLTEEKVPKPYPMLPLAQKIKDPGSTYSEPQTLVMFNYGMSEHHLHVAHIATLTFAEKYDRYPAASDVSEVLVIAKGLLSSGEIVLEDFELDESICAKVVSHSGIELQPMAAFLGGVVAQEVVKVTGKFTPIPGWFHFSSFEVLPTDPPSDTMPRNSRYDELAGVFGWQFLEKLGNLKYFMVGCGALGCEFLKNFALNGVCCGPNGRLVVTDADRIELSNLTRQFLFREVNVGQPKSRAGCAMATKMNGDLKVAALEQFVAKNTEHIFDDAFWMGLDGVCNALDNMEARQYVDTQCVKYEKSLLESGTMGTSGNVDTIKPFDTKTYRDGGNAVEGGGVPMCTLRNFPHLTDHCIEWARDQFELLFVKLAKSCAKYMENPVAFEEDKRSLSDAEPAQAIFEIRGVLAFMKAARHPTVGSVMQLAFDLFHMLFRDRIMDLQAAFPADSRMKNKDGADIGPFWSEKKRYPSVAAFNPEDESHQNFITSATCIFGVVLGLFPQKTEGDDSWLQSFRNPEWVKSLVPSLSVPPYLKSPVKTGTEADEALAKASGDNPVVDTLLDELRGTANGVQLPPIETIDFEKDDDLNFHIAFITAAANLRCDNYFIKRTDFHSCKVIAGKIIAAIATTTAAVCGLVLLELFKVVQNKSTDDLMLRQVGLAVNNYTTFSQDRPNAFRSAIEITDPDPEDYPGVDIFDEKGNVKDEYRVKSPMKAYPEGHSVWDKLVCDGSMTLGDFIEWFKAGCGHKDPTSLVLKKWDIIYGYGDKDHKPVTTPIYPPRPVVDHSLLPGLDLSKPQATMAIMKNTAIVQSMKQTYINLWDITKKGEVSSNIEITLATTLREILMKAEALGDEMESRGKVKTKNMSHIADRSFWIIPGDESPSCETASGETVKFLASIKIMLK